MKRFKNFTDRMTGHKLNNQGSTLLTVIICIAFISILASLMLSVTMTNLQMKIVESKSKDNFYSSESIMEKVRVASQEIASEAVKQVYENDVLKNYAFYLALEEEPRNELIQQKVVAQFMKIIGNVDTYADYGSIITQAETVGIKLKRFPDEATGKNYFYSNNYLTEDEYNTFAWADPTYTDPPVLFCEGSGSDYSVRMKDITIRYVKGEYQTAVATDIVITMPKFSFKDGTEQVHYRMEQPYKQYVLLADGAINSDNPDGTTTIQGNVYAGEGININGQNSNRHQVTIKDGTVVTRMNITVSDTAKLLITGTAEHPALVWAKNLITDTTPAYPTGSTSTTDLSINGINIIQDDLSLEGQNSKVSLQGAYIGYTGLHTAEGSSMIINGSGLETSLDLSGLSDLILAGRANVSVPETPDSDADIMTGESIAVKSNQRAYLLPAKFITNVQHNPVTQEDYLDETIGTPIVTIDDSAETIKYNNYVAVTPYKIATKQTGATTLRYYYLNFASGWQADAYFKLFSNAPYLDVLNNMTPYSLKELKLPTTGAISVVGNMVSYDLTNKIKITPGMSDTYSYSNPANKTDKEVDDAVAGITLDGTVFANTAIAGKPVSSLSAMYSKISHLLTVDSTKVYNELDQTVAPSFKANCVETIVTNTGINLSSTLFNDFNKVSGDAVFSGTDPFTQSFWVVDGDVTISPLAVFNGFMIASGNITIGNGAQINGMLVSTGYSGSGTVTVGNNVTVKGRIVTTGSINLGQNCNLLTDADSEAALDGIFTSEGTMMNNIFKNAEMTIDFVVTEPASDLVDLSSMVSYENWRKIE